MKVLVTGYNGQLGFDVVKELNKRGILDVKGTTQQELDITDEIKVKTYIKEFNPDAIIHCAAYTAVDKAEVEDEKCYHVNALGTKYIAQIAKEINAKLVYISTDYVFDGNKDGIYEVNDETNPLSVYGKTKLEGENFVKEIMDNYFIVRISWVFGKNGNNFIKTMLRLADMGKKELNVVCDQLGSPTYTVDLASLLCDMIETNKYGTYHATNEGYCSWAEFAKLIFTKANKNVLVHEVTTDEYLSFVTQQAKRPKNSKMSKKSLIDASFKLLPSFEDALERFLKEIN